MSKMAKFSLSKLIFCMVIMYSLSDMAYSQTADTIGLMFVGQYYEKFDGGDRSQIGHFYGSHSVLTFEGHPSLGRSAIETKIKNLPFSVIKHVITTVDSQRIPAAGDGMIIAIHVVGQLKTDDDPAHSFSETFILEQKVDGSFVVSNNIFRLSLHHG